MRKFTVIDGGREDEAKKGIGLSLTNGIIDYLNSQIDIISKEGEDFRVAKARMIAGVTMATAHIICSEPASSNMYDTYVTGLKSAVEFLKEQEGLE